MVRVLSLVVLVAAGSALSASAGEVETAGRTLAVPPPMVLPPVDLPAITPRPFFRDSSRRADGPVVPPPLNADAEENLADAAAANEPPRRLIDRLPRPKWSLRLPSLPFRSRQPEPSAAAIAPEAPLVTLPQTPLEPTDGVFRTLLPNRPAEVGRRDPLPPTDSDVPRLSVRPDVFGEF